MLNQILPVAAEANSSGIFLKNYLEYIEEFPDDIMRIISICRELDIKTNNIVNEADELSEKITQSTGDKRAKLFARIQQILIKLQDLKDEKIHYGQMLSEMIETKFRAVDRDFQNNINNKQERTLQSPVPSSSSTARNASIVQQVFSALPLKNSSAPGSNMSSSTNNSASENNNGGNGSGDKGSKRVRRTRTDPNVDVERLDVPIKTEPSTSKQVAAATQAIAGVKKAVATAVASKKKNNKRKTSARQSGGQATQPVQEQVAGALQDDTIDPDEETYCLCGQISYGEMILCENDLCPIEWFHFSCVSLQSKPKGRWYCPNCRGDRPNVMNKNLRKKYQDSPNTDRKFV